VHWHVAVHHGLMYGIISVQDYSLISLLRSTDGCHSKALTKIAAHLAARSEVCLDEDQIWSMLRVQIYTLLARMSQRLSRDINSDC
jgi:hypothetical protein